MRNKKNVSSLSAHVLQKKKGIIATPFNNHLKDMMKLSSWTKERMPEYLWLGLILQNYGRRDGIEKSCQILHEISKTIKSLSLPRISMILNLTDKEQRKVYDIICKVVDRRVMSPLTILYKNKSYPIFNEYFHIPQLTVEYRMYILEKAIKIYAPVQSFETTDLRFIVVSFMIFSKRLHSPIDIGNVFQEYSYLDHDDDKMKLYRPTIRCMEAQGLIEDNIQFYTKFWRDIGMITTCNPFVIKFDENVENYDDFICECRKVLKYVLVTNKEKSLAEDRFDVIIGSITYALKIFTEIHNNSLGNSILGRHGIRTIIEILIILKYLLKREAENPRIWEEYKLYGIGKYKLVLLKARECESDLRKETHFIPPIADAIVNEIIFEEFTDVDLKYFDKHGIREKSQDVGEKKLYDLFYDYDSSFVHGLWGAIRESAMLSCDNAAHLYHSIPDIYSNQSLSDVKSDSVLVLKKLFLLMAETYEIPDDYLTNISD